MELHEARQVFEMAFRYWPKGSVFRYLGINRVTGKVFGCTVNTPTELAYLANWSDLAKRDSYWLINATQKKNGTRCSTSDITNWCYLPVDIDPPTDSTPSIPNLNAAADFILNRLREHLQLTTKLSHHRVFSGRGMQLLIPLLHEDTHDCPNLAPVIRQHLRWLDGLTLPISQPMRIDASCSDAARYMRLPYTVNQKTGIKSFIDFTAPRANYAITGKLVREAELYKPAPPPEQPESAGVWQEYLPFMTVMGRRYVCEGAEEPGRHDAAFKALASLHELGCPKHETKKALLFGSRLCAPPLDPKEIIDMLDRRYKTRTLDDLDDVALTPYSPPE